MNKSDVLVPSIDWDAIAIRKLVTLKPQYQSLPCLLPFLKILNLRSDARLVDFGCYNGYELIQIAELNRGWLLTGYDISQVAIDQGNRDIEVRQLSDRISLHRHDIQCISHIPDRSFDFSLSKYVLPFLAHPEHFLREMRRVTSGKCMIAVPVLVDSRNSNISQHSRQISMDRAVLMSMLKKIFRDDFKVETTYIVEGVGDLLVDVIIA